MQRVRASLPVVIVGSVLWAGCGEWVDLSARLIDAGSQPREPGQPRADAGAAPGAGAGPGERLDLTLISFFGWSNDYFVGEPHEVIALDASGAPLSPALRARSHPSNGALVLAGIPSGLRPMLHVIGRGLGDSDSHDTISLSYDSDAAANLLPVQVNGSSRVAATTGAYTPRADRAALWGSVYWRRPGGERAGSVGCAMVALDGDDSDLRYVRELLPVRPAEQPATMQGARYSFVFGNIAPGAHTLRVSLDGGESFVASASFHIPRARQDALGPAQDVAYALAVDVEAAFDPTPAECELRSETPHSP
jgi:hypothetical protein